MRNFSPEPWRLHGEPEKVRGARINRQAPVLRHFTARFELV
ncbi:MAG TPA: tryptophanase [Thermoanaerobaculia bacterium]|nr:tryptophanase [Thermoanaerobaculia bacterium]